MSFDKKIIFWGIIFCLISLSTLHANLLKAPPKVKPSELEGIIKNFYSEMTWCASSSDVLISVSFLYDEGHTTLKIKFEGDFPQALKKQKKLFIFSRDEGKAVWTYIFSPYQKKKKLIGNSEKEIQSQEESMGLVHHPLDIKNSYPKEILLKDLLSFLKDKRAIFYTGAGISAGVVPTMSQIIEIMELKKIKNPHIAPPYIQDIIKHPKKYLKFMDTFYHQCLYGDPTLAHEAINSIISLKDWGLITENLDLLHQRSGMNPLHRGEKMWLKKSVNKDDLLKIDVVLTVGLANDESGFLGWYKEHHPQGTIIAFNLECPPYLGNEDYLIKGDVQKLLPQLSEMITCCLHEKKQPSLLQDN